MHAALQWIRSTAPPAGAIAAGWPWWAVAIVLFVSSGPVWAMDWLDVVDRLRGLGSPTNRQVAAEAENSDGS